MNVVPVKTTYLEMINPPSYEALPPSRSCLVTQAESPSVDFYKFLYKSVGKDWHWVDRLMMPSTELQAIIRNPLVEIYVLYVDGVPAGYAELDRRIKNDIELAYFGIMPEFIGKRFGKYLLRWAVKKAWEYRPERLWLHTCELDHPAALPTYRKAGFAIYKEEIIQQPLPDTENGS